MNKEAQQQKLSPMPETPVVLEDNKPHNPVDALLGSQTCTETA